MKDALIYNDLARDARRALEREREKRIEKVNEVESLLQILDASDEWIEEINDLTDDLEKAKTENEDLRQQLQEEKEARAKVEMQLAEMNKLSAGMVKKTSQDELLKAVRTFVNKSKQKTSKKRTLIKEMVLEFTFANGIVLPEEMAATVYALDDEPEAPTEVHNHFEAGSNSQVFNEKVMGTFKGV